MTCKGQDNTQACDNINQNSSYYFGEIHEDVRMLLKWILCSDDMYGINLTTTLTTVNFSRMNVPMRPLNLVTLNHV